MKAIIPTELKKRTSDKWGEGYFGAPRGDRTHNGIDYECPPECQILSPVDGKITKHGYPYGDDLTFRYVQITTKDGYDHRLFYVEPILPIGRIVKKDTVIGFAQDLNERYPDITPHIHYEVKHEGNYLNPEKLDG
jgi:murein DD-endopeptidase MepM/ murein hydrolase activator NlpD